MPAEGISITRLRVIPLPDMKRVTVEIELSPFTEHPNLDISILSPRGEVIANMFVVEARDQVMALTLHLGQPEPAALYIARLSLVNLVQPLLGSSLMKGLREEEKATANSIRMMSMQRGGVIGPWLGGVVMERATIELPAYIGGSLYALLSLSLFVFIRGETPIQKTTPLIEVSFEEALQGDYESPLDSNE